MRVTIVGEKMVIASTTCDCVRDFCPRGVCDGDGGDRDPDFMYEESRTFDERTDPDGSNCRWGKGGRRTDDT